MVNSWTIAGNLGGNPDLRYTAQGTAVCTFSLATSHGWGSNKDTVWVDVVVWGKQGEACAEHLEKGKKVFAIGEGRLRKWEKDGKNYSKLELTAKDIKFISESKGSVKAPEEHTEVEPF